MTEPLVIARLSTSDDRFADQLDDLLSWDLEDDAEITRVVTEIIRDVRERGDVALLELTANLDRYSCGHAAELEIPQDELAGAYVSLAQAERDALDLAAARVRDYHQRQREEDWEFVDADGNRLGQRITALERVGIYVPGGQAAYPSTVLMTAIPAAVAGVDEVVMVVPTPGGVRSRLVLAAAHIAGVDRVFTVGGAQAVAALAFGTATIPRVAKIVGPGGSYVAAAKRLLFGTVGIDVIAGPSEVLVVSDGTTDADWLAMDLFSQAEHDASAQAVLISPDADHLGAVHSAMARLLPDRARRDTIAASLAARGALIHAGDLPECITVANRMAPEHLELAVAEPTNLLPLVRHAGAIFLGAHSPEVMGDYAAGPSHVLPTFGTARFSSPLGVYDFVKRSSIIGMSAGGSEKLARAVAVLAAGEGLESHARAAELRISGFDDNH